MQTSAAAIAELQGAAPALPRISAATRADVSALADLHVRAMDRVFDGVNREFSRMVAAPAVARNFIETALSDSRAVVMVARLGGRPVGYAVARNGRLEAVGVHPAHRNEGLGRLLVRNIARDVHNLAVRAPVAYGFFERVSGREGAAVETHTVEMAGQGYMGRKVVSRDFTFAPRAN